MEPTGFVGPSWRSKMMPPAVAMRTYRENQKDYGTCTTLVDTST